MDEKIKTLIWRRHCSIGQSCCSMTSKRSIDWFLESSSGMKFFHPSVRLFDKLIRSLYFHLFFFFFLFCSRVFVPRSYESRSVNVLVNFMISSDLRRNKKQTSVINIRQNVLINKACKLKKVKFFTAVIFIYREGFRSLISRVSFFCNGCSTVILPKFRNGPACHLFFLSLVTP